ncbi:helix-turn-helix domain-containing protein [Actinoalloteichus hymeniacidonis]|uniref:DNA binding protein with helix-turn-helix domain n=1 Tax=Actinoalloteichus hymeniacidonis TaxID=340345 RepID=A0AAC9MZG9_9PSEU|nr:helix-turn-helix transcriptional regulator [Actinoalloteichus hymeniacidonis]AOS64454.1 DNA binding protein with helix-turn-helix domain [Actinoalloteichus hymeniacidonis]MBB5907476.1 transcriptional regulator with XRE-family HTH domain [Actinoalloteichus hymeniacidonis]
MPSVNRSPRARALADSLRAARTENKLTVREIARRLRVNHSVISRAESGARVPKENEVATILGAIGAAPDVRDRIIEMARDVDREAWSALHHQGTSPHLSTLIKYERDAVAITDVNPLLVPGLCQTLGYARAIMSADPERVSPTEVDGLVMYRMARQRMLAESDTQFTAIIDEPVLVRQIGGRAVMAEQCNHLVEMSHRSDVDIRVIPVSAGYHPALSGGWFLMEFAEATPVLHLEHVDSGTFLHRRSDTRSFLKARDSLLAVAMSTEESARLITRYADHHRRGDDLHEPT